MSHSRDTEPSKANPLGLPPQEDTLVGQIFNTKAAINGAEDSISTLRDSISTLEKRLSGVLHDHTLAPDAYGPGAGPVGLVEDTLPPTLDMLRDETRRVLILRHQIDGLRLQLENLFNRLAL